MYNLKYDNALVCYCELVMLKLSFLICRMYVSILSCMLLHILPFSCEAKGMEQDVDNYQLYRSTVSIDC